jgi:hypothetical protein
MIDFAKYLLQYLMDEKIVVSTLAIIFSLVVLVLIHWHADKEYVMLFGTFISGLVGALLRGITHQNPSIPNIQSGPTK